jgi:hypothetical protein
VFIRRHCGENAANRLTDGAMDPFTKTPAYRVCAVSLAQVA